MRNPEDNVKTVLCDLVAKGASWDQAYAELIGVMEANMHDLEVRGNDLVNKLTEEGKAESYIRFRVEGFQRAYDRELLYLHATRAVQASGYRG